MMAVPIVTATPGHRHWPRWHRRRLRAWTRRDVAGSIPSILGTIPSFSRAELGRLTQHMIDRMDEIDGDPDLEHLREDDEDTHDREEEQAHE